MKRFKINKETFDRRKVYLYVMLTTNLLLFAIEAKLRNFKR